MEESSIQKEEEYVHAVYNKIAPHFSATRYKPWPIVTSFLESRSIGSVGIDVGCGNGKYLDINPNVLLIGSDHSSGLIQCANEINPNYNVLVADGMRLPHRENTFDFAISIAVVHHWSTRERRIAAIQHIMSKLRSKGQLLVYCWALEQGSSRRGYKEGMEQDVLVPWVLHNLKKEEKVNQKNGKKKSSSDKPNLEGIPPNERSKYVAEWKAKREQEREEEKKKEEEQKSKDLKEKAEEKTEYRYYHLYKEGELEEDCERAGGKVLRGGYEKDNWYVVVEKQ